jgi:hypothetical protein
MSLQSEAEAAWSHRLTSDLLWRGLSKLVHENIANPKQAGRACYSARTLLFDQGKPRNPGFICAAYDRRLVILRQRIVVAARQLRSATRLDILVSDITTTRAGPRLPPPALRNFCYNITFLCIAQNASKLFDRPAWSYPTIEPCAPMRVIPRNHSRTRKRWQMPGNDINLRTIGRRFLVAARRPTSERAHWKRRAKAFSPSAGCDCLHDGDPPAQGSRNGLDVTVRWIAENRRDRNVVPRDRARREQVTIPSPAGGLAWLVISDRPLPLPRSAAGLTGELLASVLSRKFVA